MTDRLPPMTFTERCRLSSASLPKSPYRAMLEALHSEMLAEILAEMVRSGDTIEEPIAWHPAVRPPHANLLVLIFNQHGWQAGYWDGEHWRDDENVAVTLVTHWARPGGPL